MVYLNVLYSMKFPGGFKKNDALKLYELAYFSTGNILELGTNNGLSTSIMVQALSDSHKKYNLETVDLYHNEAKNNLRNIPGYELINFIVNDAKKVMDELILDSRKFSLLFVDHNHSYEHTKEVIIRLEKLLNPNSFIIFHDYSDLVNVTKFPDEGVYQAIKDYLIPNTKFEFYGCFGCSALFHFI